MAGRTATTSEARYGDGAADRASNRLAGGASQRLASPILAIIVPTLNERQNVEPLLHLLTAALPGVAWEAIFVDDDSPDGTAAQVRALARRDPRVRCLQRIGRRGLASACIEGALASAAPYVAIMDADLQHDETLLPKMLEIIEGGAADLVIASRYVAAGGTGDWDRGRARLSRLGTRLARFVTKADIADPLSGFFMCRREVFEQSVRRMSGQGFKILLDLLASVSTPPRVAEVPYVFRRRQFGESKLDAFVLWEFVMLLADKLVGRYIPIRFVPFAAVGGFGLCVHLAVLSAALHRLRLDFPTAQALAAVAAMTSNFFLNNQLTYRDQRLAGLDLVRGLASFYLICGVGAIANVGVAAYVFASDPVWWLAGVAGAAIGAVWNFAMTSVFTWKRR